MIDRRSLILASTAIPLFGTGVRAEGPVKLRDLYNKDLSFSQLAQDLEGQSITVKGFMVPPFKAESKFFVLTKCRWQCARSAKPRPNGLTTSSGLYR